MPDNRVKLTEEDRFEIFQRVAVNGEKPYHVAKDKKVETSTITRLIEGNPQRNKPAFKELLAVDQELAKRYAQWVQTDSEDFETFRSSEIAQKWLRTKMGKKSFAYFEKIVTGEIVPSYKINPLKLNSLEKVNEFIDLYKQTKGLDDDAIVTAGLRRTLRSWLQQGLGINVPRGSGGDYGISGEKVNFGIYGDVYYTDEQIDTAYDLVAGIAEKQKVDPFEATALWSGGLETFARTDRLFQLQTAIPKIETIQGHQLYFFKMLETKTDRVWPKVILDTRAVEAMKAQIELRKGKQYLFLNPEKPEQVKTQSKIRQGVYYGVLRELARQLGIPESYEIKSTPAYFYRRPLYSLRHSGAHLWLRRRYNQTGVWDFGYVASMGWDDMETLKRCYGQLPPDVLLNGINGMLGAMK
ncbi:hypothetical protein HY605_01190 [Candidatus Peregrinibacteria bacterium]|nr:hypothetical protein [Candidatus Peregrinibacteria bacterium]